ncbi:peroxidase 12 [Amborella trichopoda]|nr:peroxidase 12 [Amborella trichopoda]|eukprot:XP_006846908.2 peroxidase 12 [Amborella trichopoda]
MKVVMVWLPLCGLGIVGQEKGNGAFPIAPGLSWTYYINACPALEPLVQEKIASILSQDVTLAPAILRLQFHDCFVLGCDASILLARSEEQDAAPNLTLRREAFQLISEIKSLVDAHCGVVVSCADILALAARDSVYQVGGPFYPVPLGRKDSLVAANTSTTLANIPSPNFTVPSLIAAFASKGLNAHDLVSLSGAHTIGVAHCSSFTNRLYPQLDPTLLPSYSTFLYAKCPSVNSTNTTAMDRYTPYWFDNKYYVELLNYEGLFTSDEDLYMNNTTRPLVESFSNQQALFFEEFAWGMVKMSQLHVLTGPSGEIRGNCSMNNPVLYINVPSKSSPNRVQ